MKTVGADFVASSAALWPWETAIADRGTGELVSFSELDRRTRSIATGLVAKGVGVVVTRRGMTLDHLLLLVSALRVGIPVFPISPRWPIGSARKLAARAGGTLWEETRMTGGDDQGWAGTTPSCATILTTSGSSGDPKIVLHALEAHLASARASQHMLPLEPGCGWLLNLSPSHVSGLGILFRCLLHGATVVLPAEGEFEAAVSDPRVTHLSVVSTQLARLLEGGIRFGQLRAVLAGGGHVPVRSVNAAIKAECPLHLTYGMTETASQITTGPRLTESSDQFSLGSPLPGTLLRTDGAGVLMVRSPSLCLGYLRDDGGIESVTGNGEWFRTRDLGRIDDAGRLWDLGRADRMFISGGENIHPESIERALEECTGVRRSVVLPVSDPVFGQRPVAFISWMGSLDTASVEEVLRRRLPGFMVPVRFFDWLPEVDDSMAKIPLDPFRLYLEGSRGGGGGS